MSSYIFRIEGKVQGVYYRKTVAENANRCNLSGYVKNMSDGSVEAGLSVKNEGDLEKFLAILKKGSLSSVVTNIVQKNTQENFEGKFEVRR